MKLWEPSLERIRNSNIEALRKSIESSEGLNLAGTHELYQWSIDNSEKFWSLAWGKLGIQFSKSYSSIIENKEQMPGAAWFTGASLNFAQNLLRYRDDRPALIFWGEEKVNKRLTYSELFNLTSSLSAYMRSIGIAPGDRVAGLMPNMPEAVIAMLATTSLGAIWTSCSPDFGVEGILDRFGQTKPKILFCADGYFFKGQALDSLEKVSALSSKLPSLEKIIVAPYTRSSKDFALPDKALHLEEIYASCPASSSIEFAQLPFDHPIYIMYSSGTTGKPKCIVHGAGGILLEHQKELVWHCDLKRQDCIFYQTTCGWMMWNWLISSLASGASIVLYDGSPLLKNGSILFDLAQDEKVTIFGTNAKFIASIDKIGLEPAKTHDLSALKTILSTGSPLAPESFDYVYAKIKTDVCLSSIAGGTDILGCFALGSPTLPVYRSELQMRSLGLKVEVFNQDGQSVQRQKGELVCSAPFPSMPIYFWDDEQGDKYHKAYFETFANVWHHGDFVELTEHQGLIYHGRSDAILNPGGVRIGTAEIYSQVEKLPEILESIAVAQEWKGDVRVILFVKLVEGQRLDQKLIDKIKKQIRSNASPFHVPAKILQVADIPRTRSGKIVEIAVRESIHARSVKNIEALANPEALAHFRNLKELEDD